MKIFQRFYFVLCMYVFYLHTCELPYGDWEWDFSSLQGQVLLSHCSSPSRTLFILKTCKFHTYQDDFLFPCLAVIASVFSLSSLLLQTCLQHEMPSSNSRLSKRFLKCLSYLIALPFSVLACFFPSFLVRCMNNFPPMSTNEQQLHSCFAVCFVKKHHSSRAYLLPNIYHSSSSLSFDQFYFFSSCLEVQSAQHWIV